MSLFAGTLLAFFVVVGLPHLFLCPAPRRTLADSEMMVTADGQQIQKIRRRRRKDGDILDQNDQPMSAATDEEVLAFMQLQQEANRLEYTRRECPVPKPSGKLGELLGFKNHENGQQQQQSGQPEFPQPGLSDREN